MDTADALRAQRAHAAQRTSQIPPTGRPGSPRPVLAIEPLSRRSADRRGIRSGTAGTRSLRPSFSAPSWPPGAPSRRLGSGRARLGLCPDREPGAGSPALRPLRTGPPAGSPPCGPHAARTHTQCPRAVSAPLRPLALSHSEGLDLLPSARKRAPGKACGVRVAAGSGAGPEPPTEFGDQRRGPGRRRASGRSRVRGGRVGLRTSLR